MGLIDIHVPKPRVENYINLSKVESTLEKLSTTQGKELPKIRSALEVLAGIKSKELAKLEHRYEILKCMYPPTEFIDDMPEYYKEAVNEQDVLLSKIGELKRKIAFGDEGE